MAQLEGRPKVLVLIKGLGIGGAERLISEGARVWDTQNFEYHVAYVLPHKSQLVARIESAGIEVTCIGGGRGLATILSFRRLVKLLRPDLIHAHLPMTGVLARVFSAQPVVYTEHNVASSYRVPMRLANWLTYWRNRLVFAVSDAVKDSVSRYPAKVVRVVPNGVLVPAVPIDALSVRTELGAGDRPFVAHVGNIRPWKGHSNLIKAVQIVARDVPDVLVASIGVEKEPGDLARVQDEAVELGVEHAIRFLGRREDAVDFIQQADIYVNPSDMEGLPLVVLEAMMAGTPVVATDVGGVSTIIKDMETGLLVDKADPQALADGIIALLEAPQIAASYATAAKELAVSEYGIELMVQCHEAGYKEVLSG